MNVVKGINQAIKADRKRLREYTRRRKALLARFNSMPRGSRARCGFDLAIAPVSISSVLNGKRVSLVTLELIEVWVMRQESVVRDEPVSEPEVTA